MSGALCSAFFMEVNMNQNDVIDEIVGLNILEASQIVRDNGFIFRVTKTNGNSHAVTRDYNLKRINVTIEDNEVINANVG